MECAICMAVRGNGNPLQYSCLKTPMDRVAWQATVHGATRSQTWLSKGAHYTQGASQVVLVVRNLPDKAGDIRDVG